MTTPSVDRAPRTEAARTLLDLLYNEDEAATFTAQQVIAAILAIEAEAAQAGPPLDVLTLTEAIVQAVGAAGPDDFGIAYRDRKGFSPHGLAESVLARLSEPK